VMGTLVHESKVGSTCASAPLWQHRARGVKCIQMTGS
jgi:hypothetical protein